MFSSQTYDSLAWLAGGGGGFVGACPLSHVALGHALKLSGPQFLIGQEAMLTSTVRFAGVREGLLRCEIDMCVQDCP